MNDQKPGGPRPWFRIEARAAAEENQPTIAEVFIYDEIGERFWGGGVSAQVLATDLAALDVDTIRVFINSPGGAAWDGVSIMNALRRHKARVEVTVDGLAASAASVIAMAGDHIIMNRGAEMMIHDASGGAWGPADLMEETAGILHKLSDSIADIYAARAGGGRQTWRTAMLAETWYTAEEAVTAGLADEWVDAPAATAAFDRSKFSARADARRPHFEAPELPSSTEPGDPNQKEALAMSDTIKAGLIERLGVKDADISDEALLAAVDEALDEQAETTNTVTAALPEGVVTIDSTVLASLQADARRGAEARAEQDSTRRDGIIAEALRDGRITSATREKWRASLDKDETGAAELLAGLAKNAVPVEPVGVSDTLTSTDDALYSAMYGANEKEA